MKKSLYSDEYYKSNANTHHSKGNNRFKNKSSKNHYDTEYYASNDKAKLVEDKDGNDYYGGHGEYVKEYYDKYPDLYKTRHADNVAYKESKDDNKAYASGSFE